MGIEARTIHEGLEGIAVAATELSHVDGERGVLVLRGTSVERLAPAATFEDAAALFWNGGLPDSRERAAIQARLYAGRARAFERLPQLRAALTTPLAMDALRGGIAQLCEHDTTDVPALLTGAMPVFVAAHTRLRAGREPLPPSPERSQAADYLAMMRGGEPEPARVRALDTYLTAVSDHGLNASTFTARVVASTAADSVSAVTAAIGALKGPLHGSAPEEVLEMLDAIGTTERAEAWLEARVNRGERIMGMGHRIYRVRDPRAAVLEAATQKLARELGTTDRSGLARAVERIATRLLDARYPERKLRANVEFDTAVLLEAIGIERGSFAATFAIGRVIGWLAHIAEQRKKGRLIRPQSVYVGPLPPELQGAVADARS